MLKSVEISPVGSNPWLGGKFDILIELPAAHFYETVSCYD